MSEAEEHVFEEFDGSLLRSIIETAPDAILTVDMHSQILTFSPAAEKMFGYRADEVIGERVTMLMPESFRRGHDRQVAHYLETGEKRVIGIGREVRGLRKNGEEFNAEIALGELTSGDERIFTGFIRDVTDRVEAQRKAARLQRSLDQLSRTRLLGEMSSALAHEINQPLAAISNFARAATRLMGDEATDTEKAVRYLDRIAEQAQRAGEIIQRMRRLIERGKADLSPNDIGDVIHEAIRSHLGPLQDAKAITIDLPDGLPEVMADRIQIQQVVLNLIRNAQEAMSGDADESVDDHHGTVELSVGFDGPDQVIVTISDEGPGLPADLEERLFEPFVTGNRSGIGIGLSVCRSIVHGHGGQIWARNRDGGGAEFHFTLPVARPE